MPLASVTDVGEPNEPPDPTFDHVTVFVSCAVEQMLFCFRQVLRIPIRTVLTNRGIELADVRSGRFEFQVKRGIDVDPIVRIMRLNVEVGLHRNVPGLQMIV